MPQKFHMGTIIKVYKTHRIVMMIVIIMKVFLQRQFPEKKIDKVLYNLHVQFGA